MTIQELLKANGLSDEQITAIAAGMKEHKIFTAGEENLDIRYGKLKTNYDALLKKNGEAETLIEQLKQSTAGSEELQGKIAGYETQLLNLQKENDDLRVNSALNLALLEAKASDVDYMAFKVKEKGELALDENGKIKGWDDLLTGLKTQYPSHFEAGSKMKVIPNVLPDGDPRDGAVTPEAFKNMGYQDRLNLFKENPEVYKQLTKK